MKIEYLLITDILFAHFEEADMTFHFNKFAITNNMNRITQEFGEDEIRRSLGSHILDSLKKSHACAFFKGNVEIDVLQNKKKMFQSFIDEFRFTIADLFSVFWLECDHSASLASSYLLIKDNEKLTLSYIVGGLTASADGTEKRLLLKKNAVKSVLEKQGLIDKLMLGVYNLAKKDEVKNSPSKFGYNYFNRILKAIKFIDIARGVYFLPLRITNYVAALECLFTTDEHNIQQKIAQRGAYYLGGSEDQIIYNYNAIKTAYDVRSDFMHGQKIERGKTESALVKIGIEIDEISRRIINKIITLDSEIFIRNRIKDTYVNVKGERYPTIELGIEPFLDALVPDDKKKY